MSSNSDASSIADKMAIREVLDEYCLRPEVIPFEVWMALFTEDSVYEVYGKSLQGRAEIAAMLSQAPHGVHVGGAARITISGDTAQTIQNYVFYGKNDKYSNKGWYYRTLVRTAQGWQISHTRVEFQKPATD